MILKFKGCSAIDEWVYLDGIEQVSKVSYPITSALIRQYDEQNKQQLCTTDEVEVIKPEDADKVFYSALGGHNCPSRMLLNHERVARDYPTSVIHVTYKECLKESEVLVTNQSVYLLNDQGQTIERLV
jgi:hypothetical protein